LAAHPSARYCSSRCKDRKRSRPASVTEIRKEPAERSDMREMTRRELEAGGRLDTAGGLAAMLAAERLDRSGMQDTGAGFAAALKAHREALAEALKDPEVPGGSALEEIRRNAALKLVRGA
jgi:hypothetical protein